jgi:polyhydroxybutyrate depolymerase
MAALRTVAALSAIATFSLFAGCKPQGTCDALAPGNYDCRIEHDGLQRRYLVFVPPSYTGESAVPLVVDSPGFSSPALGQRLISGMERIATEKNFIVAWPEGTGDILSLNGAGCCDLFGTNVDDMGFIRKMVAGIQAAANIDAQRIYATGESNGGAITHRLGCEAADLFAAVAPVAFSIAEDFPCTPSHPISSMMFQSVEDWLVPFEGGTLGSSLPAAVLPLFQRLFEDSEEAMNFDTRVYSAQQTFEVWGAANQCDGIVINTLQRGSSYCEQYSDCAETAVVGRCVVHGNSQPLGGHLAYTNDDEVPVADMIWEFFEADYQRKQNPL